MTIKKKALLAAAVLLAAVLAGVGVFFALRPAPQPFAPQLAAAGDATFYVDEAGVLWAWGGNPAGQLGDGTQADSSLPVKVLEDVVQVSAGGNHTVAVKSDGSLWGWGLCQSGRLLSTPGNALYELGGMEMPVQTLPVKLMDGVKQAAAGVACTLILKEDGTLWSTGGLIMGENGQWLDDDEGLIQLLDGVASCAAGYDSASAITTDGSCYIWGTLKSSDPQLAAGYHKPIKAEGVNIACTSYNYGQVLSVLQDGKLSCLSVGSKAGATLWEQPEDGKILGGLPYRLAEIDLGVKAVQPAAGLGFSAALTQDGALWMWGAGARGQLGNGHTADADQPMKVLEGVAQVACGNSHTAVLKTDGSVWSWGDGGYGQVGPYSFGVQDYFCPSPLRIYLTPPAEAAEMTVTTGYALNVDGVEREHWCYALPQDKAEMGKWIHYSTLSSVAALLDGTSKAFSFTWDAGTKRLSLTTGSAAELTGSELTPPSAGTFAPDPLTGTVLLDGREIFLRGYLVNGEPCFAISDLGAALGVGVSFDQAKGLSLDTTPAG